MAFLTQFCSSKLNANKVFKVLNLNHRGNQRKNKNESTTKISQMRVCEDASLGECKLGQGRDGFDWAGCSKALELQGESGKDLGVDKS